MFYGRAAALRGQVFSCTGWCNENSIVSGSNGNIKLIRNGLCAALSGVFCKSISGSCFEQAPLSSHFSSEEWQKGTFLSTVEKKGGKIHARRAKPEFFEFLQFRRRICPRGYRTSVFSLSGIRALIRLVTLRSHVTITCYILYYLSHNPHQRDGVFLRD